jgi:hypothetical protein
MDGTFKSSPAIFTKIYTLHIELHSQFFPVVMALLPDKQEQTYRRFIRVMCNEATNRQLHLQPQVVHCDYEMAVFNAVQLEWGVQATGCLFHFDQSIYRHVQSIGLQVNYNTDNPPGVRKWLRRIMALPLVPPLRLPGVYQEIMQQAPPIPEVPIMHQYVDQTYMSQNGPLFSAAQWNVFGTVNRTINMCEGFHRALNEAVSVRHPSIYRLIEVFQDIEAANERNIAQLTMGAAPKRKRAKYVIVNKAIQRLVNDTFGRGIPTMHRVLTYVDAVAYQLWDIKH